MPDKSAPLIHNKDAMRQIKRFSGLQFGRIYPTDIDGFLDFGDKLFIFFELKYGDASLKRGQELALERVCDACESDTRRSCMLVARHNTVIGEEIDVANAIVTRVRYDRKWYDYVEKHETLRECIDKIRRKNHVS